MRIAGGGRAAFLSLREVLLTAWDKAKGLRGKPDILRANRYVAQADPGLAEDLARIGVRLEIADAKDKALPASLCTAQDASRWLWQRHNPVDFSLTTCIEALCIDAQVDHDRRARRGPRGLSNIEIFLNPDSRWPEMPAFINDFGGWLCLEASDVLSRHWRNQG